MGMTLTVKLGLLVTRVKASPAKDDDKSSGANIICTQYASTVNDKGVTVEGKTHNPSPTLSITRCKFCLREGARTDFPERGWAHPDETVTRFTPEQRSEASAAVPEIAKVLLQVAWCRRDDVDLATLPAGPVHYLAQQEADEQYPLIVHLIRERPDLAFVARWVPQTALSIVQLGVRGNVLTARQLAFPEKVRAAPPLRQETFNEAYLAPMHQLLDDGVVPFDLTEWRDGRADVLKQLAAGEAVAGALPQQTGALTGGNLLDALRAEVDRMFTPETETKPVKRAAKKAAPKIPNKPVPQPAAALEADNVKPLAAAKAEKAVRKVAPRKAAAS